MLFQDCNMRTIWKYYSLFAVASVLLLPSCTSKDAPIPEIPDDPASPEVVIELPELTKAEQALGAHANKLGFAAFSAISQQEENRGKDLFYSPLSLGMNLSMVAMGAREKTRNQIQDVLGFADASISEVNEYYQKLSTILSGIDPAVIFENANSIWVQEDFPVKSDFQEGLSTYYSADSRVVNFKTKAAQQAIEKWCSEKTHGRIDKIDELSPNTVVTLINALYFKGAWGVEFGKKLEEKPFTHSDNNTTTESFFSGGVIVGYEQTEQLAAISIPFSNFLDFTFNFIVFLPKQVCSGKEMGALLEQDGQLLIDALTTNGPDFVRVSLPKFTIQQNQYLRTVLTSLGVKDAFDKDLSDFTGISDKKPLWIDDIAQYTWLAVDETGCEAAAATLEALSWANLDAPEPPSFVADRPFAFAIQEKTTGALLFMGVKQ